MNNIIDKIFEMFHMKPMNNTIDKMTEMFGQEMEEQDIISKHIDGIEMKSIYYDDNVVGFISFMDDVLYSIYVHPNYRCHGLATKYIINGNYKSVHNPCNIIKHIILKNKLDIKELIIPDPYFIDIT